uniref:Uncharacterized protein n=1 Tax=Pseudictyota dubia TaxID=2749911 RepID=A0A7R9WJX2_9STRA|mmetsp:Transcript_8313/g.15203  ORF Transcript_8313/g.15203 Transcript_8313/m.15203 type:complete len:103 (+) Transcript_8313:255-563(+)
MRLSSISCFLSCIELFERIALQICLLSTSLICALSRVALMGPTHILLCKQAQSVGDAQALHPRSTTQYKKSVAQDLNGETQKHSVLPSIRPTNNVVMCDWQP